MTQEDKPDDSRIETIGRVIANATENNPIDAARKWYGRTFGPLGFALLYAICAAISFRGMVLLSWPADNPSTLDLAITIVAFVGWLVVGLIAAFLMIACVIIWWHDDGERTRSSVSGSESD